MALPSSLPTLVFPRHCPACGSAHGPDADLGSDTLCSDCAERSRPITPPFCNCCGEPFDGEIATESFRCSHCASREFAFDFAIAGYKADGPAREIIHRFKYGKELHLARVAANMLAEALEDERIASANLPWSLVPVPLHWIRRYRRGFNQAEELCRYLHKLSGYPVNKALRRIRNTPRQVSLNRKARLENLRDAFSLKKNHSSIRGNSILLVDDVFTTGSTAHECARVLKEGGAERVIVVTMAR